MKARLEQTEATLERIVAHMGSLTDRLARNGVMVGDTQVLDTKILYMGGNYDLFFSISHVLGSNKKTQTRE